MKPNLDDLLKDCPFDGGLAEFNSRSGRRFVFSVRCVVCMVRTPWFRTPELAMDIWNRRVGDLPKKVFPDPDYPERGQWE